jgi:hypothetical protein
LFYFFGGRLHASGAGLCASIFLKTPKVLGTFGVFKKISAAIPAANPLHKNKKPIGLGHRILDL